MAVAVWLVGPLGSITWLGSLKSHPGALPTSGKASGPNSPRPGCWLASGSSSSCEGQISLSTPVAMTGPAGFGIWGGGGGGTLWDSQTRRNFRLNRKSNPRSRVSTYREIRLMGLKEHLVIPSQNCSPPPLAESPLMLLNPSRKNGRSHTSLLLTGVRGGVSTFDIPKKRNRYIHGNETTNTWTKNNMEKLSNIITMKIYHAVPSLFKGFSCLNNKRESVKTGNNIAQKHKKNKFVSSGNVKDKIL